MLVDIEDSRVDQRDLLHFSIRIGKILKRSVNVLATDSIPPPILDDYLSDAVKL